MAAPKLEPQIHMLETEIEDAELEAHISDYLEGRDAHRAWLKSKAAIRAKLESRIEGRYRVGSYVIEIKAREGGGVSIPDWTAKVFSIKES